MTREIFEAWYATRPAETEEPTYYVLPRVRDAWDAWQAAIKHEREECAKVCEDEVVDALATGSREDLAYNMATEHCAAAIRARAGSLPQQEG